ncbi:MAG: protein kinase [Nannocystaceae bacterium]
MLGGAQVDPVMTLAGATLGKYKLIRRLATGGMAELFLARATAIHGFEKLVVLKRILPQHAESDDFIRMFLAEARLAATLHHPNIVQVYDIGEQGNTYFFTMEYVAGQDLRKLVRSARKAQKALPLEHILHVIMGVAAGLHHAHEKIGLDGKPLGIVHRDVSPSNVLVTYEGGVKIVDFGIAKAASAQTNTVAGTLKGKIPYMSPEQCRGEVVDRRSDIFSIGTLMWELTTGSRLFTGENEFAVINKVAAGEVPMPTTVRGDYPPELEAIVMRALQPDRDLRYASALDLQIDLEDFCREARLPVSSARMAKFMRELFGDEMRASAQALTVDRVDEQPTMQRSVMSPEMLMAAPPGTGEPSVELTPSEVRANQMQGTPGPVEVGYGPGSSTDIHLDGDPPRTSTEAVVLAVIVGIIAVLGIASAVYYFGFSSDPETEPGGDGTPAAIVESPESTPAQSTVAADADGATEPEARTEVPVELELRPPTRPESQVLEGELVQGTPADALGGTGEPEAADEAADSGQEEAASEPPPEKDDKTESKTDGSRKRASKKRSGRRPSPKAASSGTKSKPWDPDSPFPI